LKPGAALPGTNYFFEQVGSTFVLKNHSTQETTDIFAGDGYNLLYHGNQIYLITAATEQSGTAHALDFGVYNITTDTPHDLINNHFGNENGRSCTFPRLNGDALEFEIGIHCDDLTYTVASDSEPHDYSIRLQ
ncbi:MAG TPA: hypothetical protein VHD90_22060, partial [Phototrophicaceae bacterium]|nr:hypothetical protein [Phototrophicaceae bacterium]